MDRTAASLAHDSRLAEGDVISLARAAQKTAGPINGRLSLKIVDSVIERESAAKPALRSISAHI